MLAQILYADFLVGEVSCPCVYSEDASSINFRRSITYGLGVLWTSLSYFLARHGWRRDPLFDLEHGRRLPAGEGPAEAESVPRGGAAEPAGGAERGAS
jgi:hypothetical protein